MSQSSSPVIRLADYRPTPYAIDKVDLDFDLTPEATLVTAVLVTIALIIPQIKRKLAKRR